MKNIKLFCIPFAGGSANSFLPFKEHISDFIDFYPIELAGRGKRFNLPLYKNFDDMIDDICKIIQKNIYNSQYAIFGHSMGSIAALAIAHKMRSINDNIPVHMFLSGNKAPHLKRIKSLSNLSDCELIDELIGFGGIPNELFKNEEIVKLILPIIRNDILITEHFTFENYNESLLCDLSIFWGNKDNMDFNEVREWSSYTQKKCILYEFTGNHFFIYNHIKDLTKIINSTLNRYINK